MSSPFRTSQTLDNSRKLAIAVAPRSGAVPVAVGFQPTNMLHRNKQRRGATPEAGAQNIPPKRLLNQALLSMSGEIVGNDKP